MAPSNTASFYRILAYSIEGWAILDLGRLYFYFTFLHLLFSAFLYGALNNHWRQHHTSSAAIPASCHFGDDGTSIARDFGDILSFFSVGLDEDCHF